MSRQTEGKTFRIKEDTETVYRIRSNKHGFSDRPFVEAEHPRDRKGRFSEIGAVSTIRSIVERSDRPHQALEEHIETLSGFSNVNLPVLDEGEDREEMVATLATAAKNDMLGEAVQITHATGDKHGVYTFNLKRLGFNPRTSSEELEGLVDEGFSVGESIEWLVLHELGHANHHSEIGDISDVEDRMFEGSLASTRDGEFVGRDRLEMIENEVSSYARANPAEFVAEVFAGKAMGQDFPDEIMDIYEEWGGPDAWENYR